MSDYADAAAEENREDLSSYVFALAAEHLAARFEVAELRRWRAWQTLRDDTEVGECLGPSVDAI